MKRLKTKYFTLTLAFMLVFTSISFAQQGEVIVNQDQKIATLLKLKKEVNSDENSSNRYKIQIYSGRRGNAEKAELDFKYSYGQWSSKVVYETPNYKTWVGSFRSRLEADRALLKIKRKFPNAFIFKPKKKKNE